MSNAQASDAGVISADGVPLKVSLARALRRQKIRALMLIAVAERSYAQTVDAFRRHLGA